MFITDQVFGISYNEAMKKNIDLIQLQDLILTEFHFPNHSELGKIIQWIFLHDDTYLEQPKIKNKRFNGYNFLLWGLLIKTYIYQNAIHTLCR